MGLERKFHKTGGSHIIFIVSRTICDEKKIILAAALPGIFLMTRNLCILMLFLVSLQFKPTKNLKNNNRKEKFYFKLCLFGVFSIHKNNEIKFLKHIRPQKNVFIHMLDLGILFQIS
jgi:hypothetical protein